MKSEYTVMKTHRNEICSFRRNFCFGMLEIWQFNNQSLFIILLTENLSNQIFFSLHIKMNSDQNVSTTILINSIIQIINIKFYSIKSEYCIDFLFQVYASLLLFLSLPLSWKINCDSYFVIFACKIFLLWKTDFLIFIRKHWTLIRKSIFWLQAY